MALLFAVVSLLSGGAAHAMWCLLPLTDQYPVSCDGGACKPLFRAVQVRGARGGRRSRRRLALSPAFLWTGFIAWRRRGAGPHPAPWGGGRVWA